MEQIIYDMLKQARNEYEDAKKEGSDLGTLNFLLGRVDALQSVMIKILYLKNFNHLKEN